jgi:hypothetical protein
MELGNYVCVERQRHTTEIEATQTADNMKDKK